MSEEKSSTLRTESFYFETSDRIVNVGSRAVGTFTHSFMMMNFVCVLWPCCSVINETFTALGVKHYLVKWAVLCTDLGIAAADEQQRQQISEQQDGHLVGAFGGSGPLLPAECAVGGGVVVGEDLVLGHRHRAHQRQRPDDAYPGQRVPAAPDARRVLGAHHGDVAVHGHGHQREDAHQHADREEVVSDLTEESSEHPLIQRVDGGVQRDAQQQEAEVSHTQVQDEDVGGAAGAPPPSSPTSPSAVPHLTDHHHHQTVPHHPHHENQPEYHRHDHRLRPGPAAGYLGPVGLRKLNPAGGVVSRQ